MADRLFPAFDVPDIEEDEEYEIAVDAFDEWLDEQEFEEIDD